LTGDSGYNVVSKGRASRRDGAMQLYMFEHCSLCCRVRMMAALKRRHLQEVIVLDDDTETLTSLVGRRVIPIMVKDNGEPMLESMDMVDHIDKEGEPLLIGETRDELLVLEQSLLENLPPLTMPRYPLLGLPEFATVAARDHFIIRKRERFGDFTELRAKTRSLIATLMPDLETLDRLIERPDSINGRLSRDDIRLFPLLRSAGVVQGLRLPDRVRAYAETMMGRTGLQPLPSI
jgi:glutaredoxin 2